MTKLIKTISKQNVRLLLASSLAFSIALIIAILSYSIYATAKSNKNGASAPNTNYAQSTRAQLGLPLTLDVMWIPTFSPVPSQTSLPTVTPLPTELLFTETPPESTPSTIVPPLEHTTAANVDDQSSECEPPDNWESYQVKDGDTLFAFQLGAGSAGNPATVEEIMAANCINSSLLNIGQTLWLPPGAVENAPSSQPVVPQLPAELSRNAQCPCTITVREGWRVEQIADEINRTPVAFTGADFLTYVQRGSPKPDRPFLASLPSSSGLEGFMFPGTYTLQNDTSAQQFRDMLLNTFEANAAGIINQAAAHGMSPYQLVILASVVQRESFSVQEQPLIASVFHNRLAAGKGLGATVTTMYALGSPGNWWPRLQRGQINIDTLYNTNIYGGLPPTPISNPGLSALQSTAAPAQTNFLYFTGDCRGPGNAYAATYEEHLANVRCE